MTAPPCGCTISACDLHKNAAGELGFAGLCRRRPGPHPDDRQDDPRLPAQEDLLSLSEAILRVYNLDGRRDNKYKARIKILVHETRHRIYPPGRGRIRRTRRRGGSTLPQPSSSASAHISRRRPSSSWLSDERSTFAARI
jgi:hypothetical protein